jgi:hypothetical protein
MPVFFVREASHDKQSIAHTKVQRTDCCLRWL